MSTVVTSSGGTPLATTVGTEHTVVSAYASAGTFQFVANFENLALGDVFELRARRKTVSGDSATNQCYFAAVANVQGDKTKISLPISVPASVALEFSIKQTAGTSRNVSWSFEQLA